VGPAGAWGGVNGFVYARRWRCRVALSAWVGRLIFFGPPGRCAADPARARWSAHVPPSPSCTLSISSFQFFTAGLAPPTSTMRPSLASVNRRPRFNSENVRHAVRMRSARQGHTHIYKVCGRPAPSASPDHLQPDFQWLTCGPGFICHCTVQLTVEESLLLPPSPAVSSVTYHTIGFLLSFLM
jgi:hypothetical protein